MDEIIGLNSSLLLLQPFAWREPDPLGLRSQAGVPAVKHQTSQLPTLPGHL